MGTSNFQEGRIFYFDFCEISHNPQRYHDGESLEKDCISLSSTETQRVEWIPVSSFKFLLYAFTSISVGESELCHLRVLSWGWAIVRGQTKVSDGGSTEQTAVFPEGMISLEQIWSRLWQSSLPCVEFWNFSFLFPQEICKSLKVVSSITQGRPWSRTCDFQTLMAKKGKQPQRASVAHKAPPPEEDNPRVSRSVALWGPWGSGALDDGDRVWTRPILCPLSGVSFPMQ